MLYVLGTLSQVNKKEVWMFVSNMWDSRNNVEIFVGGTQLTRRKIYCGVVCNGDSRRFLVIKIKKDYFQIHVLCSTSFIYPHKFTVLPPRLTDIYLIITLCRVAFSITNTNQNWMAMQCLTTMFAWIEFYVFFNHLVNMTIHSLL